LTFARVTLVARSYGNVDEARAPGTLFDGP
jgi:hypothetical protein